MYPSDFSGGMRQRVMIAMALAGHPHLLIADEPTTALDTTTQRQVLDLLRDLNAREGMAVLLVSHDLGVVRSICSRVHVMYLGQIVEEVCAEDLLARTAHPYSQGLIASVPPLTGPVADVRLDIPGTVPPLTAIPAGCRFAPRCRFADERCRAQEPPLAGKGLRRERFRAVDDLSFEVGEGEVYGLVGESGSGKSTTGRLILGLERPDSGSVLYRGQELVGLSDRERKPLRREIQLVFQDSSAAFDPRNRVGRILEEPLVIAGEGDAAARRERALESFAMVGLQREHYDVYPHELSGGQRQRLNLAHALITGSRLLVCDEPVSALEVIAHPQDPYTKSLIDAIP